MLLNVVFDLFLNIAFNPGHLYTKVVFMTNDGALIDSLGGAAKVAEILGLDKNGGVQRVHNWKSRGIPAQVKLDHPELFIRKEFSDQEKIAA